MIIVLPRYVIAAGCALLALHFFGLKVVLIGAAVIAALFVLYHGTRLVWDIGGVMSKDAIRWWRTADVPAKRRVVIQALFYSAAFIPVILSVLFQFYPPFPGFSHSVLNMALLFVPIVLFGGGFVALVIAAGVNKLRARKNDQIAH